MFFCLFFFFFCLFVILCTCSMCVFLLDASSLIVARCNMMSQELPRYTAAVLDKPPCGNYTVCLYVCACFYKQSISVHFNLHKKNNTLSW